MSFIDIPPPPEYDIGFQSTLQFDNYKYVFKYEYSDQGKRCILAGNDLHTFIQWFRNLDERYRKLYELIREGDIVAEFYDVDLSVDNCISDTDKIDMCHKIIDDILRARNAVCDQTISKKDLIVLSAHTSTKLSLHLIVRSTYFENNRLQHEFMKDVYNELNNTENVLCNIDLSVYSKNRCFRMYLNHKYGKQNTLKVFEPTTYNFATLEDTLVVLTHRDYSKRTRIHKYDMDDLIVLEHHDPTEHLTDDLKAYLHDFVNKHPYFRIEVDTRTNLIRVNRNDSTRRPCLTDPNDFHSRENMYGYIRNGELFLGCFCGKGEHLSLGTRTGIQEIELVPEPFGYGTHTSKDFKSYSDLGTFKTLIDKRRTGHGKTTCAMNYAKSFQKVLVVDHRVSLDADYINKYPEFTSYTNNIHSDKQTICFNSLSKIDVRQYDVIIIDEIRSILKQTEMSDMITSTNNLFNIFENLDTQLIMLDANLTDADVEFIMRYRNDPHRIIIHDEEVQTNKKVFIMREETDTLHKINKTIDKGEKVIIMYNRAVQYINSLLSVYKDTKRILHVNRHTIRSVDMNTDTWFDNYDIIAYSPTISEGVSVTDKRFERVPTFGLFTSTSCPAETVSQMIARFRSVECISIHINDTKTKPIPYFKSHKDVLEYLNNNLMNIHRISNIHLNMSRQDQTLRVIDDEFCKLHCKNMYESSIDYHNYRNTLIQKLVNNGYRVFNDFVQEIDEEQKEHIEQQVSELRSIEHDRVNQCILDAPVISYEEYVEIRENGVTCEEEDYKMTKYNILHSINIHPEFLDKNIVNTFRESNVRSVIKNIRKMFGFTRERGTIVRVDPTILIAEEAQRATENFSMKTDFLSQKSVVGNLSIGKLEWLNRRAQELGFEHLLSPESISLEDYENNLERLVSYYKDPNHYTEYVQCEMVFGSSYSRTKQQKITSKFITQKFLGWFALTFGKDTRQKKVYQQINIPVVLYDELNIRPNVLGDIVLPEDIVSQYDIMFMKGFLGKHCPICNTTLNTNISFKHLNSKEHILNLTKHQSLEEEEPPTPETLYIREIFSV